ncbi:MAG: hypothetical protein ACYCQL_00495 [Acidithiobacillus sp.]
MNRKQGWHRYYVAQGFPMIIQNLRVAPERMPKIEVATRGRIFWWIGAARIHEDGNGWSVVFRCWHPLTWVLFIALIPVCAFVGESIFDIVPMRVGKFFQAHPEKLIWWTPFSKRQGLLCRLPAKSKEATECNDEPF